MGLLILYVSIALWVSFLCSLLEAALLASRVATLSEQQRRGSRGAARLLEIKRTRIDDAISSVLIFNTLAHTLGATLAGAQAVRIFGSAWVGLFSAGFTLAILVLTEIIPKTVGTVYWRELTGLVGPTLAGLIRISTPALFVSRLLTRALTRGPATGVSRGELEVIIATATADGAITRAESALLENLLHASELYVGDVMTPQTVAFTMPAEATAGDLLARPEGRVFSRVPLWRGDPDNIVAYVLVREVLLALADGADRSEPLARFQREVSFVPELADVDSALRQLIERREPLAIVTDEHGAMAGLVTIEDLTETILGLEIVDELDQVPDLRQAATRLRDRRLERVAARREVERGAP